MSSPKKKPKSAAKNASSGNVRKHRPWIYVSIAAVLIPAGAVWLTHLKRPKASFSNVLVVTLDTTRADRIGAYGYRKAETPRLDALAREGVVFENAYSPVPLTLPSHCSMMTGTYPLYHQVRNHGNYFLPPDCITLAEILKERGLKTAAFVSSFVLDSRFGLDQGFDVFDARFDDSGRWKMYTSERRAEPTFLAFEKWFHENDSSPFFAWVHFFDPHAPYDPPEPFRGRLPDRPYDGEIAYMDFYVGKIMDDLEKSGALDETLVVIAGDHGEAFGEHGYLGHQIFCYEEELRIPFIIYARKGIKGNTRIKQRAGLVDIVPTVLECLRADIPAFVQGRSLASALRGREGKAREFYFESFYPLESMGCAPVIGLIHGPFKYMDLPRPELYNLENDPEEKFNQANSQPKPAAQLKEKLRGFIQIHARSEAGSKRTVSAEERARLGSLGYIAPLSGIQVKDLPDPKEKIAAFAEYTEAKTLDDEGKLEEAEERYRKAIAMNPGFGAAYGKLGDLFVKTGRLEDALKIYEAGIQASPQETFLGTQYASLLIKTEKLDEAARVVDALEKEGSRDFLVETLSLAADIQEKRGQFDLAFASLEKAKAIEPENPELVRRMVLLLNIQKRWDEALRLYQDLEKMNPDDGAVITDMALLYAKLGEYATAERYFRKALTLAHDENLYFNYALLLDRKGDVHGAADQMRKFLSSVKPDHPKYNTALLALRDFESRI